VGVIDKANEGTLGGKPIFPLRLIEGDLVGNNWEVYRRGEEYIKRIGGVTEVGSRRVAEGLEGEGHEFPVVADTSARPSDLPGRLGDIYATKVRPLEERSARESALGIRRRKMRQRFSAGFGF
jgi:hypothetical protein